MGSLKNKKTTLYGFLWHVNTEEMMISEGIAGFYCESVEAERPTEKEAEEAIKNWLAKRQKACKDGKCEHTIIVTSEITPKMYLAGMTKNMKKV